MKSAGSSKFPGKELASIFHYTTKRGSVDGKKKLRM